MHARFGLGLFAGLLLGVLVIGSAAFYPATTGAGPLEQLAPHSPSFQQALTATQSSVSSETTAATTATGTSLFVMNSSQPNASGTPSNVTGLQSSVSGVAPTVKAYGSELGSNASSVRALLASQVDNLPRQPVVISLAAFMPVVAAVLFGAVIYRVSKTRQDEEGPPGK